MLKIIKESFRLTNNYLMIATPLILFSLITSLYLIFSAGGSRFGLLLTLILLFLMLGAFLSGWFYMITKAVKDSPEITKDYSFLSEFMTGVGEYFFNILGFIVITAAVSSGIVILSILAGKSLIGNPGVTYAQVSSAAASIEAMKAFSDSLTNEQILKINCWNILLLLTMIFNYLVIMLYAPAMYFKNKNPFVALWLNIKDLFSRRFFKNIGMFLILFVSYFILSMLNAFFGSNIICHFVLTLVNFYYVTFAAILLFNYYYSNFAKIGSEIDEVV